MTIDTPTAPTAPFGVDLTTTLCEQSQLLPTTRTRAVWLASGATAYAGIVHFAVAPEHLRHWWVFGVFMIVAGVAQIALAARIVRRPTPAVALAGIIGSLVIVALFVIDHTRGLGIGPSGIDLAGGHAEGVLGGGEPAGPAAIAATIGELATVAALVTLLGPVVRRRVVNAVAGLGLAAWVAWLLGGLG
jgi:hypothetical protein